MADHARSDHPAVHEQLDRLGRLSPGRDILGLDRIAELLNALGNPHHSLPPTFHVAGTNGKGSTCTFLRAALEAEGKAVHVYSSPHLVRFNERIRIAGRLIEDDYLANILAETLDRAEELSIGASFFEITTAAAFLAFSRINADALILEVGLGGRLDATNIITKPVICGIASLGIDHEGFLLAPEEGAPEDPLCRIGWEKAGISKADAPLVIGQYPMPVHNIIAATAHKAGAPLIARTAAWDAAVIGDQLAYHDIKGSLTLPLPSMAGRHQADNAALAIAMLRHQDSLPLTEAAYATAMTKAYWPARMQKLGAGPLTALLPPGSEIWIDGGHNPDAGIALAQAWSSVPDDGLRDVHLLTGMLANKDAAGFLTTLGPLVGHFHAVPVPGHEHHSPESLCALAADKLKIANCRPATNAEEAIRHIAKAGNPVRILICGTLYLAGEILQLNSELPD